METQVRLQLTMYTLLIIYCSIREFGMFEFVLAECCLGVRVVTNVNAFIEIKDAHLSVSILAQLIKLSIPTLSEALRFLYLLLIAAFHSDCFLDLCL